MIAVRPDNEAGRLLARLVAEPGELTAEALAELLHPGRGWSEDAADALAVAMVGGRA